MRYRDIVEFGADGSARFLVTVTIRRPNVGEITVTPHIRFIPGVSFNGIDIAWIMAQLDDPV